MIIAISDIDSQVGSGSIFNRFSAIVETIFTINDK